MVVFKYILYTRFLFMEEAGEFLRL